MSKRDRHGVRNATDIERKYNLGNVKKTYSEVKELSVGFRGEIAQVSAALRQEIAQKIDSVADSQEEMAKDINTVAQKANSLAEALENAENAIATAMETADEASRKASEANDAITEATNKLTELESNVESATRIANEAFTNANGVVNDLNSRFEFVEGGTTFKGAIVPMVLPQGADLDGITLPNKYTGGSVAENQYLHCPIETGTFSLEVEACGDQGELLQRLTYGHKTEGKTYERVFHTDGWGEWITVTDYTGAALNALQGEIDALEQAFSEFVASTAEGVAETDVDIEEIADSVEALTVRTQSVERSVQSVATDLQSVITDVNDHFEFAEGGTRIKGAVVPFLLPAGTDLDGVILPNKYTGGNVAEYKYGHCPITSGTFSLEVESCGNEGQLLQRLVYSHKTNGKTYERAFYQDGWGTWVVVSDYTGAALKAVQSEVDALETALNKHKTDTAAKMAEVEGDIGTVSNSVNALAGSTQTMNSTLQSLSIDLNGVINDVNNHFDFNEGGMTIKGGINPALLPAGTDLDGLFIPNKYIGGVVTDFNYRNCPIASGTFLLEVDLCGDQEQVKQTLSYCNKTLGRTYERYYYGTAWGEWVAVTDFAATAKLLWNEGVYYMTATQTVNLPEPVSAQKNGIVLVFSEYTNGAAANSAFHCFFVQKMQVATHPGGGYTFTLATSKFAQMATKQVFIYDEKIEGHADNNQTGTGESGIKFTNNRFVLRYVLGL